MKNENGNKSPITNGNENPIRKKIKGHLKIGQKCPWRYCISHNSLCPWIVSAAKIQFIR